MKYSGHRKLLCELSKLSKFNALNLFGYYTNTDASLLVYKFRPKRTGFNMYAEYTQPQLTFLAIHPCIHLSINISRLAIHLPIHLFTHLSIYLPNHLYIRLSTWPFIYPSIYSSTKPSIHPSICGDKRKREIEYWLVYWYTFTIYTYYLIDTLEKNKMD